MDFKKLSKEKPAGEVRIAILNKNAVLIEKLIVNIMHHPSTSFRPINSVTISKLFLIKRLPFTIDKCAPA